MATEQYVVSATLALALVLFAWGRWRYDVVALATLLVLVVAQIVPAEDAFTGFGHPAVVTVVAVFVLSRTLEESGVVSFITQRLESVSQSPVLVTSGLCFLVTVFSAFMNNIGALALMLPVAIRLTSSGVLRRQMTLMPIAFGSILGGMITLIGTPPNIIVSSYREQQLGAAFAVFDFGYVGIPVALGGLVVVVLLARWVLPNRDKTRTADPYAQIEPYITELFVPDDSPLVGQPLAELEALSQGDAAILELIRADGYTSVPRRRTKLRAGDVLVIKADPDTLKAILDTQQVALAHERQFDPEHLTSGEFQVTEAVIMPGSRIAMRTSVDLRLRSVFGVNLLAISRKDAPVESRLGHERLRTGDVILLQGDVDRMDETLHRLGCLPLSGRQVVLQQVFDIVPSLIFITALALGTFGVLRVHIALVLAALAMVMMRKIPLRSAYESIDWPIIVLLGAMVPVGASLETTGVTSLIAGSMSAALIHAPHWAVLSALIVVAILLSNVVNNAATALLMAPLAYAIATQLGTSPDAALMAVAIGSSAAFLTPIGHQSNLLVMGPGGYAFGDYWRLGLPVSIAVGLISVPLLIWFWS